MKLMHRLRSFAAVISVITVMGSGLMMFPLSASVSAQTGTSPDTTTTDTTTTDTATTDTTSQDLNSQCNSSTNDSFLCQSYRQETGGVSNGVAAGVLIAYFGFIAVVTILMLAAMIKLFMKAGRKWWEAIIPVYNTVVLLQILGRPVWWILLLFIPVVNVVISIIIANDTAKAFGKGTGWTLLLIFFPYVAYPILGFGKAQYVGPVASGGAPAAGATPATPAAAGPVDQQPVYQQPTQPPAQPAPAPTVTPAAPAPAPTVAPTPAPEQTPPTPPTDQNPPTVFPQQ